MRWPGAPSVLFAPDEGSGAPKGANNGTRCDACRASIRTRSPFGAPLAAFVAAGAHFMTGRGWLQTTKLKRSRRLVQSIEARLLARYAVLVPHRRTPATPEAGLQTHRRRPPHQPSPEQTGSGIRSRLPQVITPAAPDRPTNQYASGRHPSGDVARVRIRPPAGRVKSKRPII